MGKKWGPINGKLTERDFEERHLQRLVDDPDDNRPLLQKEAEVAAVAEARIKAWSENGAVNGKLTERDYEERHLQRLVDDPDDTRTRLEKEAEVAKVAEARIKAWSDNGKKHGQLTERDRQRQLCVFFCWHGRLRFFLFFLLFFWGGDHP